MGPIEIPKEPSKTMNTPDVKKKAADGLVSTEVRFTPCVLMFEEPLCLVCCVVQYLDFAWCCVYENQSLLVQSLYRTRKVLQ